MNGYFNFRFIGTSASPRFAFASSIMAIMAIGFFSVACEKELINAGGQAELRAPSTLVPSCDDQLDASTVLGLIRTPDDPVNDRVNLILYHYAQAIRVVSQNPTHLCYMQYLMIADTNQFGVSLYTLAQGDEAFAQALNMALRQSMFENDIYPKGEEPGIELLIASPEWDANSFLRGKMEYIPYTYDPVVYFIKRPVACDASKQPTIVIAQDVNDCDDVAGWRGNNEVLVSEAEASSSEDPIIFVGPGQGVYKTSQFTGQPNQVTLNNEDIEESVSEPSGPTGLEERSNIDIDADLHQIKAGYRYERSKRSEIYGWVVIYDPTSEFGVTNLSWEDFSPRRIHKNDINDSKTFFDDRDAFQIPSSAFAVGRSIFYGAYEHDWYASKKWVFNTCAASNFVLRHSVEVRMKFLHEWYFFNCGVASTIFPSTGSTWEANNNKCRFVLKRVN
jgi:hypothetical protein